MSEQFKNSNGIYYKRLQRSRVNRFESPNLRIVTVSLSKLQNELMPLFLWSQGRNGKAVTEGLQITFEQSGIIHLTFNQMLQLSRFLWVLILAAKHLSGKYNLLSSQCNEMLSYQPFNIAVDINLIILYVSNKLQLS